MKYPNLNRYFILTGTQPKIHSESLPFLKTMDLSDKEVNGAPKLGLPISWTQSFPSSVDNYLQYPVTTGFVKRTTQGSSNRRKSTESLCRRRPPTNSSLGRRPKSSSFSVVDTKRSFCRPDNFIENPC